MALSPAVRKGWTVFLWAMLIGWALLMFVRTHQALSVTDEAKQVLNQRLDTSSIFSAFSPSSSIFSNANDDGTPSGLEPASFLAKPAGAAIREHLLQRYGREAIIPQPSGVVPEEPPSEPLGDILARWNPDDVTNIPFPFHERLMVFNYSDPAERAMMKQWHAREFPFKVYDIPNINEVVAKWADDRYLEKSLSASSRSFHTEYSSSNHFMWWSGSGSGIKGWKPPTKNIRMSFKEWLQIAKRYDRTEDFENGKLPHYYFMTGTPAGQTKGHFVVEDLTLFSTKTNNDFITDVTKNKGIQCRFGMRGIIAEAHYDAGKNMVAMLKGAKRYILAAPSECPHLSIISERKHPSFRHSDLDWSKPTSELPADFLASRAVDTILREGEILYIPSFYIHYPASLTYSIQCNSRSGQPPPKQGFGEKEIEDCVQGPAFGNKRFN